MHHAPAVSFPVGVSRRAVALHRAIAGAGGLGAMGWCLHFAAFDGATLLIAIAAMSGVVLAARAAAPAGSGMLHWAGGEWSITDLRGLNPQPGGAALVVIMDLGTLILARYAGCDGSTIWLWLDRDADPVRWRALRRAAFDGARMVAEPRGEGASA